MNKVVMTIIAKYNGKIEQYLIKQTKVILSKLGFNDEYTKTYINYQQMNKLIILEEIAVITFEVFNLLEKNEMKIIVE